MGGKDNLGAVRKQLLENKRKAPYLSEWKHLKSGHIYVVRMHVIRKDTLEPAVIYYRKYADPHEAWDRIASEFFDGRFEPVGDKD